MDLFYIAVLFVLVLVFVVSFWVTFNSHKIFQAWAYLVNQIFFFPRSYRILKAENVALKQELEYSQRNAGALKINVDALMAKVKVLEHFLTLTSEQLQAKGKVEADIQYFQRQDAFYKEQLEEVRRELAAEYEYGAKLKARLLGSEALSNELAGKLSVALQNNKKPKKKSSRSFSELHRGRKS